MRKYEIGLFNINEQTSGPYYEYTFTVHDLKTKKNEWIDIHVSHTLAHLLRRDSYMDYVPLAAKAAEYHVRRQIPETCYKEGKQGPIIVLSTDWYPKYNDKPDERTPYQVFEVSVLWEENELGRGDYNLLPHQEHLLREIVETYTNGNGRFQPTFFVHAGVGDAAIVWDGDPQLVYDGSTLVEDLQQLATEGLLGSSPQGSYRVTRASIEAVKNNFIISSEAASPSSPVIQTAPHLNFSFITATDFRTIIERDYQEVRNLVSVQAHKSTLVLCGSITEAILLERLKADEAKAKASASALKLRHSSAALEEWDLSELVKVAEKLGILGSDAANLADQLRNYRNVIHPGVERRKGFEPSQGKAHAALSLLSLIVEALS